MILTLHMTENCNMNCAYCTREKASRDMSVEVLDAACKLLFTDGRAAGISFFGGEPLLKKDLVLRALEYCTARAKQENVSFETKLTTNGTLLDEAFLKEAVKYRLIIGLSFDGIGQDICRRMANGDGSLATVEEKAKLLLSYLPGSYAMATIAPQAAHTFFESVKYLYGLGFRRITATIALGNKVTWTQEALDIIEAQLRQIADFYCDCLFNGDPFFFSPFDGKINDAIAGKTPGERCQLGRKQMQVFVDGNIYACTQFIGDEDYCIGDVYGGLDPVKWTGVVQRSLARPEPSDCVSCDLRSRCTHTCGCVNRLETGNENLVSPLQCTYEQIVISVSDMVADRILETNEALFWKKYKH